MPNNRLRIRRSDTAPHVPAASRASWTGMLQLNDFSVPVKAYPAIASSESNLHLIHTGCGRRVSLQKFCPEHGSIESTDTKKAFEYSPNLLVELSDKELSALDPDDDKTIVIERFLAPDRFDLTLLAGRTLFLAPANSAAQHAFSLLKAAFDQKKAWALGRTVFSRKRQLVVIHSRGETVLVHTLHDPASRRLPVPCPTNGHAPSPREVRNFTRAMTGRAVPIRWVDYCDDSQEQLATLVARKVGAPSDNRSGKTKALAKPKRHKLARAAARAA